MKRFHIFVGDYYYPEKHINNYAQSVYTKEEAKRIIVQDYSHEDWWAIVWTNDEGELVLLESGNGEDV